jgi:hypothetical protein
MPIKHRTRHDPPMPKKETATGLFVQRGETGEKPNKATMDYALKVGSKHRAIGGTKTLTR